MSGLPLDILRAESSSLWHKSGGTLALGCSECPLQLDCGGLSIAAPAHDCLALCGCIEPEKCPVICPRQKPREYAIAVQEVQGLGLLNVPHAPIRRAGRLPSYIPFVQGRSKRDVPLPTAAVALPLQRLFDGRTGKARFTNRREILAHFKVSERASLVIDSVATDQPLENYWGIARDAGVIEVIAHIKPALAITPNFSLFLNVPRHNDLYNIKRIVTTWSEWARSGISVALHVNARTDRDYARYAEFLRAYPEIHTIAFEFGTGARSRSRRGWHLGHLSQLQTLVGRDLRLVIRGGWKSAPKLAQAFSNLSMIDTDPYMKTMKRFRAAGQGWRKTFTLEGASLDELLNHAIRRRRGLFNRRLRRKDD